MEINYLTGKVLNSIVFTKKKEYLAKATDIKDLKTIWLRQFYKKGEEIPTGFIKGAKLIQFEVIWEYVKS